MVKLPERLSFVFGLNSWQDFAKQKMRAVQGFPGGSDGKESACNAEDPGSIPGSGRSPGEGNGNPLQYSCLENAVDRGTWRAPVQGVAKSQTHSATDTTEGMKPLTQ